MSDTQYFNLRTRAGCDECERELICTRIAKRKHIDDELYLAEWVGGDQRIMDNIKDGFGCSDKQEKVGDLNVA